MKSKTKLIILLMILMAVSFFLDDLMFNLVDFIRNPMLDFFMGWITNGWTVFFVFIFMSTLLLWIEKKRKWIFPLWFSSLAAVAISFIMKIIIERQRPFFDVFIPLLHLPDYSFPSTHAMVSFAAVPILIKDFRNLRWFWLSFAALVGFSRIYAKFHRFSDVVFGALIGLLIGFLVVKIEERYGFLRKWKHWK